MTEFEFNELAQQGYNRIPLTLQTMADLDTPLSLYRKLAETQNHGINSFLLESVVGGERFGRYSFIGLPASTWLRVIHHENTPQTEIIVNGLVVETLTGNPLDAIAVFQNRFKVAIPAGFPRFCGGLAGYFGYDAVRFIEKKLTHQPFKDELNIPDILLLLTEELAVIDNLSNTLTLIVYANPHEINAYQTGIARLNALQERLNQSIPYPVLKSKPVTPIQRPFNKEAYLAAVEKAKDYVMAGDLMQVQIGQRLVKSYTESPLDLYRALRALNPSPYMYFYHFGEFQVVGASPEILVRQENREEAGQQKKMVVIRPIAGTRPRGKSIEQDKQLATELLADPKEIAEHVMLIDLARNDVGRIAVTGSVRVSDKMVIEKYSHVQHIVSHVEGELKPGLSNLDVLKATFPAGTLSGAPKVRAMELIDELEISKRGLYGGAVGYLSFGGEMDIAIAIRTGIVKDQVLYVQAAAGVVADSIPEAEWQETENKARAVLQAAERVQEGLKTA